MNSDIKIPCGTCDGTGYVYVGDVADCCSDCDGSGVIDDPAFDEPIPFALTEAVPE